MQHRTGGDRLRLLTPPPETAMKRFHVHAHVQDLQASIDFYSKMFAAEPSASTRPTPVIQPIAPPTQRTTRCMIPR